MKRSILGPLILAVGCWGRPDAELVLSAPAPRTTEGGGTATLAVSLGASPTETVRIDVLSGDPAEGAVVDVASGLPGAATTLEFTTANWDAPQVVTLVGVDDPVADGDVTWFVQVAVASSADDRYSEMDGERLTFTNADDDTPAIVLSRTTLTTWEAGAQTDSFTVALTMRPADAVTIRVSSGDPGEGRLRSSTLPNVSDPSIDLVFTPSDWSTPREVTVVGQGDGVADGDQSFTVSVAAVAGEAVYVALPVQWVDVVVRDVDAMTFIQRPTLPAEITEGYALSACVALPVAPSTAVFLPVRSGDSSELLVAPHGSGGPFVDALTLALAPGQGTACFELKGARDCEADGTQRVSLSLGPTSSADAAWDGQPVQAIGLSVVDVDLPGRECLSPEGTAEAPLDVTAALPWHGMVDMTASHYRVNGLAGLVRVSLANALAPLVARVDGDGDFTSGTLCTASAVMGVREWCFTRVPASGSLWVKVDGGYSLAGSPFDLDVEPFLAGTDVPKTIPDGSPTGAISSITVSGAPTSLAGVRVAVDATHAYAYDLEATLVSPAGTRVPLFANVYSSTYAGGYPWTLFDAAAEMRIDGGYGVENAFRPIGFLESLAGEDGNGTWSLEMVDRINLGWSGQIVDWGLSLR